MGQLLNDGAEQKPVLDKAGAMQRLDNDEELYQEIFKVFLEDVPTQMVVLSDALGCSDIKVAERTAHSLKSASGNIGGEAMRAVAMQMEFAGKSNNLALMRELMPVLTEAFEAIKLVGKR